MTEAEKAFKEWISKKCKICNHDKTDIAVRSFEEHCKDANATPEEAGGLTYFRGFLSGYAAALEVEKKKSCETCRHFVMLVVKYFNTRTGRDMPMTQCKEVMIINQGSDFSCCKWEPKQ